MKHTAEMLEMQTLSIVLGRRIAKKIANPERLETLYYQRFQAFLKPQKLQKSCKNTLLYKDEVKRHITK